MDSTILGAEPRIKMMNYMVHFKYNGQSLCFEVYPTQGYLSDKFCYISKENDPDEIEVFEEGKCLMRFGGWFCWRGVWEGRLYFTDDEYWGEELSEMSELYNKHIVPWCKDFIKKQRPDGCFDE